MKTRLALLLLSLAACGGSNGAVPYATPGPDYNPNIAGPPIVSASQLTGTCTEFVIVAEEDGTFTYGEYILPVSRRGVIVQGTCAFAACGTFGVQC